MQYWTRYLVQWFSKTPDTMTDFKRTSQKHYGLHDTLQGVSTKCNIYKANCIRIYFLLTADGIIWDNLALASGSMYASIAMESCNDISAPKPPKMRAMSCYICVPSTLFFFWLNCHIVPLFSYPICTSQAVQPSFQSMTNVTPVRQNSFKWKSITSFLLWSRHWHNLRWFMP